MSKTCSECYSRPVTPYSELEREVILCPKHAAVDELIDLVDAFSHEVADTDFHGAASLKKRGREALARYKETQP